MLYFYSKFQEKVLYLYENIYLNIGQTLNQKNEKTENKYIIINLKSKEIELGRELEIDKMEANKEKKMRLLGRTDSEIFKNITVIEKK